MKHAFTLIELIFAVVIVGILAAIAMPKLAATRSDAEGAAVVSGLAACINEAGNRFMLTGSFSHYSQDDNMTANCRKAKECFSFVENDDNGSLKVDNLVSTDKKCVEAQEIARQNLLIGTKTITF